MRFSSTRGVMMVVFCLTVCSNSYLQLNSYLAIKPSIILSCIKLSFLCFLSFKEPIFSVLAQLIATAHVGQMIQGRQLGLSVIVWCQKWDSAKSVGFILVDKFTIDG